MPTVDEIRQALSKVNDPELHRDLVSLGMITEVRVDGSKVSVTVELTTPACPLKSQIQRDCEEAIRQVAGVDQVEITMSSRTRGSKSGDRTNQDLLPQVKNVILVASGKGGVGKSAVAVNIAASLARKGAVTGLLDADIYGPSIPTMMGVRRQPEVARISGKERIMPVPAHGVQLMSIGFFVEPAQAVVWRGPMLHKALEQFLGDVQWGEMDYLIVDVPPGTGDVHISVAGFVRPSGAVLVTTPQQVALADVVRGRTMFNTVQIPVLGLVENMSSFVCDNCGKEHQIFSRGGGEAAAKKLGIPFLGEVPILPGIRASCDAGVPIVIQEPEGAATKAFDRIVDQLVGELAKRAVQAEESGPKLQLVD